MDILYKTIHGSKLYGLSHENSDDDFYTVVSKVKTAKARYSTHKIIGSEDSVVVDFGTWLMQCEKGVPQALEAMFSETPLVDKIPELRRGFRVGTEVYDTYLRTIKSSALTGDFKKKRHSLRLAFNMKSIRQRGRFNPTLTEMQKEIATGLASLPDQYVYDWAKEIAWS
jgi:predicted nucleotidyltransferase